MFNWHLFFSLLFDYRFHKKRRNWNNPVLNNDDFSQLRIRNGMAEGENVLVQYGYERRSPIDLLGYCMNVVAKKASLTAPNKISIGENIYERLHPKILNENGWKYVNHSTGKVYKVYSLSEWSVNMTVILPAHW